MFCDYAYNCFVIMPIAECEGYEPNHFAHVYNDIIKPAVAKTEYTATRADEVKEYQLNSSGYT